MYFTMFPSGNHIIRELSNTIGVAGSIWEKIKSGKEVLEFIGDIPEWANYERNLQENLDSLSSKRRELICMDEDLEDEVKTIEFQTNGKRKREVSNWQRNVKAKIVDVDTQEQEIERRNFIVRFVFRAWLGKCVKMEEEEVERLIMRRGALGSGSGLVLDASNGTIEYKLVTSGLVGKVSSKTRFKIWTMLLNKKVRILGVLGDQGIGKTTMMANVYNLEVAYSGVFDRAFYVSVGEGSDVYSLQGAIGDAMSLRDMTSVRCLVRRATRIHDALKSSGRFLVILDGLSEFFGLNEVGIPVEEGGGKVVVVTRSRIVSQKICDKVIRMEKMAEKDSEELFWKTIGSSIEVSHEIEDVAKEIIRECGGVPSRVFETALALRGVNEICEWRVKLREFQSIDDNNILPPSL